MCLAHASELALHFYKDLIGCAETACVSADAGAQCSGVQDTSTMCLSCETAAFTQFCASQANLCRMN
jgi:hypothetical protein